MDDAAREARWAGAMRAALHGDRTAYAGLLTELAAFLRPLAAARLGRMGFGAQDVEDVVQETLAAIHRKRDTWDGDRPFLPWVRAIARHKALDAGRRLARARARSHATPVEDMADALPAPAEPSAAAARDAETLVAALPGRERGVVAALGLEGLSVAAAARRFAISEGAVRVAFHRGLARLRALAAADAPDAASETGRRAAR
jgi:RNA polymerase sigma-70 factor (ECF subfamily)